MYPNKSKGYFLNSRCHKGRFLANAVFCMHCPLQPWTLEPWQLGGCMLAATPGQNIIEMLLPHRMYLIESKVRFVVSVLVWADNAKRCKFGSKKKNICERLKFLDLGGRFYGEKRPFYGVSTVCLRSSCSQFPRLHSIEKKSHTKTPERTFADHQIV